MRDRLAVKHSVIASPRARSCRAGLCSLTAKPFLQEAPAASSFPPFDPSAKPERTGQHATNGYRSGYELRIGYHVEDASHRPYADPPKWPVGHRVDTFLGLLDVPGEDDKRCGWSSGLTTERRALRERTTRKATSGHLSEKHSNPHRTRTGSAYAQRPRSERRPQSAETAHPNTRRLASRTRRDRRRFRDCRPLGQPIRGTPHPGQYQWAWRCEKSGRP